MGIQLDFYPLKIRLNNDFILPWDWEKNALVSLGKEAKGYKGSS